MALIAASAIRTCLGDGPETFAALVRGESGAAPLCGVPADRVGVRYGYHVTEPPSPEDAGTPGRAGRLLAACLAEAVATAPLDSSRQRIVVLVGTGLRELPAVEHWATGGALPGRDELDFAAVVRTAVPGVADVFTISNACSAGGHALALAQDLVETGAADAAIACGVDTMTTSMLTMIGKVAPRPTRQVRPFDRERDGVLLGEGAAAVVVVPDVAGGQGSALGRLVATGLSCDAHHETAPDIEGITRAMRDAYDRSGRSPAAVDLVVAHGTGTALNDPAEAEALRKALLGAGADPLVTAVKGSTGHTSGAAALVNVDVALRSIAEGTVPPVVGLREPLAEGEGIRFVRDAPVRARPRLAQVNAFGFGGVNAVTLLEAA